MPQEYRILKYESGKLPDSRPPLKPGQYACHLASCMIGGSPGVGMICFPLPQRNVY